MQIVIGIFADGTETQVAILLTPCQLGEEVAVPLTPHIGIGIREAADNTSRQSSLRVEVIRVPLESLPECTSLYAEHPDVGVPPRPRRVLIFGMVFKRVFTRR